MKCKYEFNRDELWILSFALEDASHQTILGDKMRRIADRLHDMFANEFDLRIKEKWSEIKVEQENSTGMSE